jgi:hypothetical protein
VPPQPPLPNADRCPEEPLSSVQFFVLHTDLDNRRGRPDELDLEAAIHRKQDHPLDGQSDGQSGRWLFGVAMS